MSAPDVKGPIDVLDLRLHMLDKWRAGGAWDKTSAFMSLAAQQGKIKERDWQVQHLSQGDMWWVSPEMTDVVTSVAKNLPGDVRPSDVGEGFGHRGGLVVFGRDVVGTDAKVADHKVLVSAIVYGPTLMTEMPILNRPDTSCVSITSYRRIRFEDGLSPDELEIALRTGAINEAQLNLMGKNRNGPLTESTYNAIGTAWFPLGRSDWPLEDTITTPISRAVDFGHHMDESNEEDRRLLAAVFLVASQERLTDLQRIRPSRQAARPTVRAGLEPEVNVIYLRKPVHPVSYDENGEGREVDWSCWWMVSAHPRWQPCGPERSERKLIIVKPHTKGDQSKPFKPPKATVRAIVR